MLHYYGIAENFLKSRNTISQHNQETTKYSGVWFLSGEKWFTDELGFRQIAVVCVLFLAPVC